MTEMTLLAARTIRTLDPAHEGDTVAVADGRILAVGDRADLIDAHPGAVVDDRYADAVLLPGFVEAHAHSIAGGIWDHVYVGYFDNRDPEGRVWAGCRSLESVLDRLREADAALDDPSAVLWAWGLDPIYFPGERLVAEHLDRVSTTRPIFVIHASLHLATVNNALMRRAGIDADTLAEGVPKDGAGNPIGELQEPAAMMLAQEAAMGFFLSLVTPEATAAYGRLAANAGITTLADLGSGSIAGDDAVAKWQRVVNDESFAARVSVFHNPGRDGADGLADIGELVKSRKAESTAKLRFGGVKFVLDGSIQGFTARLTEPYLDGKPNGLWLIPPAQFADWIRPVVDADLLLHVHCNGDEAVDVFLDAFTEATGGSPADDHRTTVQHSQLTRDDQYRRIAELGMCANLFSNHVWFWGDQHVGVTVGPQRAAGMNAAKTVLELGIPLSIHSDAPVTPLGSLHVAWCATNRRTADGEVLGETERLTVTEALHAITLGAAHQLRMDDEIGSITPGKRADFAVLDADPVDVGAGGLRDIGVHGTVLGGVHHPAG